MKIITSTKETKWKEKEAEVVSCDEELDSVTVCETDRKVVWDGFGGCFNELGKLAIDGLANEEQEKIYDCLFSPEADGLHCEYCRIPIGASDYALDWYSCNENDGDYEMKLFSIERDKKLLITYIKEALKRNPDIKFFASPWSPPTWMKFPKVYNYGKLIRTPENLEAYALYLTKFLQAYADEGIRIEQLHVQNEVTSDQKFPSCLWNGEELAEFISKYLGPQFEKYGIDTEIWLGTINATGEKDTYLAPFSNRYDLYAHRVLDDKEAYQFIKGVSYQWEGKNALWSTIESYPELNYIQSENECGDGKNTWEYAKYVFELIKHYIRGGVCGYIYWNMVLSPNGESTWGWKQNAMITVDDKKIIFNPEYYVMKHVARYVQRGDVVLRVLGHMSANAIAFDAKKYGRVFIVQNPFPYDKKIIIEGRVITLEADSINTIVENS